MDVGLAGQLGLRVAGDRHQAGAHAAHHGEDGQQFLARARIGDGDEHVVAGDHAQVAVDGLGGMHEEGGRAGGGQRRGDLAGDVSRFSDAAHDHAAAAGEQQVHDLGEGVVQPGGQVLQALAFNL
ncbi:hypothetical protein D3C72_1676420 [compost metagenome]